MRIVGILLAAGAGTRFGGAKLLAPLPAAAHGVSAGTPVGVAALRHMLAALPETVAVVRPGDALLDGALTQAGARVLECRNADRGMGASLAAGVTAAANADGWIVGLADMPWIDPATIDAVAGALRDGALLAAPTCNGERGHPVGFSARYRESLLALDGDEGARAVIAANRELLRLVAVTDTGILHDVDSPADLRD